MEKRTIYILVGVFVLIVGGMFAVAHFMAPVEVDNDEAAGEGQVEGESDSRYAYIDRITAKQFYIDGEHTFAGEITMPTPCDLLEVESTYTTDEGVHLQFTVINTAEACAQVMTEQRFMTSVEAPEDATVTADLMGRSIEINLVPPEPGETPDDFELFIKG